MEWQDPPEDLSGHVVICNCNEKVGSIVQELHMETLHDQPPVVLVVQDESLWLGHPEWHPPEGARERAPCYVMAGQPTSVEDLQRARVQTARSAVILADPNLGALADARSTLVAITIEELNPAAHTILELVFSQNKIHLDGTCVDEVVCLGEISERLIAQSCITPGIKNLFESLLTTAGGTNQIFVVALPQALQGQVYRDVARRAIINEAPFVLCGYVRREPLETGEVVETFVVNPRAQDTPGKDSTLTQYDELIVISTEMPNLLKYMAGPSPTEAAASG